MFNKKEIAVRRDIKRAVVELMVKCVEAAPHGLLQNAVLDDEEISAVSMLVVHGFLLARPLQPDEIAALKTAKGCNSRPSGALGSYTNLYEHLITPQRSIHDAGCMHGWVWDSALWAKQVAEKNPHSNIAWLPYQHRLDQARETVKIKLKQYFVNPGLRRPQDADEAFYWLVYQAGELSGQPNGEREWKAKFQGLDKVFREVPNLSALVDNKGIGYAAKLFEKWYINADVPAEFR